MLDSRQAADKRNGIIFRLDIRLFESSARISSGRALIIPPEADQPCGGTDLLLDEKSDVGSRYLFSSHVFSAK